MTEMWPYGLGHTMSLILGINSYVCALESIQNGNMRLFWANVGVGALAFGADRLIIRLAMKEYERMDENIDEIYR